MTAEQPAPIGRAGLSLGPRSFRGLAQEISAGTIAGFIALPFSVSAGVLAYEPLGRDYVSVGAAAGILCAVAGGITGSLARTPSFVPNVPTTSMALIQASFVTGLMTTLGGDVGVALMMLPLTAVLAGLFQILIAATGLARAVKFTPYPVLAGFVTGLAILTFVQQIPRLFDLPSLPAVAAHLASFDVRSPEMPIFGVAIVIGVVVLEKAAPRAPAMLIGLVGGTGIYHLLRATLPQVDLGGMIGAVSLDHASFGLRLDPGALKSVMSDFEIVKALLLTSLTLAVLGTLDLTFGLRSAQELGDIDLAPRRNLAAQGLSNIVSAMAGGLTVTTSISYAKTIFISGGRTRLSAISLAFLFLLVAIAAPSLVAVLPRVVLAAILVTISLRLWDRWCLTLLRDLVRMRDRHAHVRARRNAGIVAAVCTATVLGQPVIGALVGVVLSCLVFIVEMSRPVVRRRLDGTQIRSKRIRSQADLAYLHGAGRRILVLELQGVLFFGNADDLASEVRALEGGGATLILDLRRITDLDTSGATILTQIATRCRKNGLRFLVSGVDAKFRSFATDALGATAKGDLHATLDDALEAAEDMELHGSASRAPGAALAIEETDMAGGLSEVELASLKAHLTHCTYGAGEALCRTGEPADRLWLLTRGSVSVRLAGERAGRRIAGLGPGTSVGEMGLLDRRPRSADVVADEDVEAYVLTSDGFDDLLRHAPHLGQSLLATIARLTAQRLRATSDELRLAEV